MPSKDRPRGDSTAGPETLKKQDKAGARASLSKTEARRSAKAQRQGAAPAATTKPEPKAARAGRPEGARPKISADYHPQHAGIDAIAMLDKAAAEKRAAAAGKTGTGRPGAHRAAAEVIAKTMARDHRDTGAARQPLEPAEAPPKSKPAPKMPLPVEPREPIGGVGADGLPPSLVDGEDIAAILNADHSEPFSFLGMHKVGPTGTLYVRAFLPDVFDVKVLDARSGQVVAELNKVHDEGLFVGVIAGPQPPFPYRLRVTTAQDETDRDDPYRFLPVLSDRDANALATGEHLTSYQVLGAHPAQMEGVNGTTFAVWAPNASHVSVVGDFNSWDGRRHGMRRRRDCGVWEIFLPGVSPGAFYKYENQGCSRRSPGDQVRPLRLLHRAPARVCFGGARHQAIPVGRRGLDEKP